MTRITMDAGAASKLQALSEVVELCDPSGRVLGCFLPAANLADWEPISPGVSEEELDRRENSTEKTYTTAEVLDYLKKL